MLSSNCLETVIRKSSNTFVWQLKTIPGHYNVHIISSAEHEPLSRVSMTQSVFVKQHQSTAVKPPPLRTTFNTRPKPRNPIPESSLNHHPPCESFRFLYFAQPNSPSSRGARGHLDSEQG